MSHYKHHVFLCTNQREDGRQCCAMAGAAPAREYLKRRAKELGLSVPGGVRVSSAGCLGRCAEGPTLVVYPEGVWYSYASVDDIEDILQSHLVEGRILERLKIAD
jgi:(2Fe-2S) ferredoxin